MSSHLHRALPVRGWIVQKAPGLPTERYLFDLLADPNETDNLFSLNLTGEQQALSNKFAVKKDEHLRFEGVPHGPAETGAPLIEGALASLDCRVEAAHDAGDHVIYVGRVLAIARGTSPASCATISATGASNRSLLPSTRSPMRASLMLPVPGCCPA